MAETGPSAQMLPRERWGILLLTISGAALLPGALDRFVFPKLAVAAAGVLLAVSGPARGSLRPPARWGLLAAGVILVAAAVGGASPLAQILGRPPRYEGAVGLSVYLGALASGARLLGPGRARGSTVWLLDGLAIAALAIGLEAVLEAAGLRPLVSNVSRPGSLLGNAGDQGAWAVLALGPLTAVAVRPGGTLHRAGAIGAAAALATSGSRGALVGAAVLAVVLVALAPTRRAKLAIAVAGLMVAGGALALPTTRGRVLTATHLSQQTVTGRRLLWGETLQLLGDHPFLGVGPSGYVDTIPAYHDRRYETEIGPDNPPDSPHDWPLQAAAAGGPGLLLVALFVSVLVLVGGTRARAAQPTVGEGVAIGGLLAGLAGYTVALLFSFTSPGTTPLAALFAGALLASPVAQDVRAYARRRGLLVAASAVLAAGLVAAAIAELPLRSALLQAAAGNLGAADRDFNLARDLRPWDAGIAQTATHAYAVLADEHVAHASRFGLPWARSELAAYPDSIQALEDTATLQAAAGRPAEAGGPLSRARRLEPDNPRL